MEETFELPVHFNGQDIFLPAQLQTWGYSHRIVITLEEQTLVFEPDEERNYRVILSNPEKTLDAELVQVIAATIESLFR